MKKAAILCASGIGDGLLMMIAAHQLKNQGYSVTFFHDQAKILISLFKGVACLPHPPLKDLREVLQRYELILVENDNSSRAWHLFSLRTSLPQLAFFFPTFSKHRRPQDYLFDPHLPFATNVAKGCQKLFKAPFTKENGLFVPEEKTYRKYPNRVVIHPTSNDIKRNYRSSQFCRLASALENRGYMVTFSIGPKEEKERTFANLLHSDSLKETAAYIYESGYFIGNDSGLGHLASNLKIPTLTISGNPKRVKLWKPDWYIGRVVTLPFPLPNFKGINFRFRENYWQHFIPVQRTLKAFLQLVRDYESSNHLF